MLVGDRRNVLCISPHKGSVSQRRAISVSGRFALCPRSMAVNMYASWGSSKKGFASDNSYENTRKVLQHPRKLGPTSKITCPMA